ncbi:hypothetical protein AB0J35_16465 [Nonomuraea angiospora]|uniref:hypothetical protein n=1 Tax=Nonomuraea angiospora TaxID=46172 RepID=UPI003431F35F
MRKSICSPEYAELTSVEIRSASGSPGWRAGSSAGGAPTGGAPTGGAPTGR